MRKDRNRFLVERCCARMKGIVWIEGVLVAQVVCVFRKFSDGRMSRDRMGKGWASSE